MEWPEVDYSTYTYDTEVTQKYIWLKAAEAAAFDIDSYSSKTPEDAARVKAQIKAFRQNLEASTQWKSDYRQLVEEFVALQASVSSEQSLDMAQAGLDACHEQILYRIDDTTTVPCKDVFMLTSGFPKLQTATVNGGKAPDVQFEYGLPNPLDPDDLLYGADAMAQIDAWYQYGCIETSASGLAKSTLQQEQHLPQQLSRKKIILLGCTAELGPAKAWLQIPGITLMGIARGGPKLDALLDFISTHCPDDTTFIYNPKGADLLTQGPQIAQWILDHTQPNEELIIMPLAHATYSTMQEGEEGDGEEADTRLAISMDLILQRVFRQRPQAILCQYLSPTTVMVLPPTATTVACKRLQDRPKWEKWTNTLTMGKWLTPATPSSNNDYAILNGIISSQGPHHVLAKMIQQWRAMITYYRDGQVVASPYAPLSRTQSNASILSTIEGMHHFEPMVGFHPSCSSSLMGSVLLSQIQFLNRPLPDMEENPFTMFWEASCHGGVWSCPYSLESISTLNWAMGKVGYYPANYVPPGAVAKTKEERDAIPVPDPIQVLKEMENSNNDNLPDYVKERLDFM